MLTLEIAILPLTLPRKILELKDPKMPVRIVALFGFLPGRDANNEIKTRHILALQTEPPLDLGRSVYIASRYTNLKLQTQRDIPTDADPSRWVNWLKYEVIQVAGRSAALKPSSDWTDDAFPTDFEFRNVSSPVVDKTEIPPDGADPVEVVVVVTDPNGTPDGSGTPAPPTPVFP